MENKKLFGRVGEEDNKDMSEKNYYGIIQTKKYRGSGLEVSVAEALLHSGLHPLLQLLFSGGFPPSQQVLPVWLPPLSCESFWSAGSFSLLLIHFLSLSSSFLLLPQKSLQSHHQTFSFFHSSLVNVPPLGHPFEQVPKSPGPWLPTSPHLPFCRMEMTVGYSGLVFTFLRQTWDIWH